MQSSQWKTIGLVVALACVLSLGLMSPGLVLAGQVKKDVCHLEGTGDYHVINIAEPAWQTHYNHGDADADGGAVPAHPGFIFDANCNLVVASSCPCDFGIDIYVSLGVDPQLECVTDFTDGSEIRLGDEAGLQSGVGPGFIASLEYAYCAVFPTSGPIEAEEILTQVEYDGCRADILAIVATLDIVSCN